MRPPEGCHGALVGFLPPQSSPDGSAMGTGWPKVPREPHKGQIPGDSSSLAAEGAPGGGHTRTHGAVFLQGTP